MEISAQRQSRPPLGRQYTVFIRTIGDIRVTVRGLPDPWAGGGIGRRQLRAMASYQVAYVGRPVDRDDLAAVANPNWRQLRRPQNLPSGMLNMFERWGISPAIHRGERSITLRRHACWISDVDLIARAYRVAMTRLHAGDLVGALNRLRLAAKHCGGIYLHDFHAQGYDLTPEQQHWEHVQRDVLHQLLQLSLDMVQHALLEDGVARLKRIGELTRDDCLLLDAVHAALGQPHLAAHYRHQADDAC